VKDAADVVIDGVEHQLNRLTACGPKGGDSCTIWCKTVYLQPEGVCKYNAKREKTECHCEGETGTIDCLIDGSGKGCDTWCRIAKGWKGGDCNKDKQCECSEERSKWGHAQDAIVDIGEKAVDWVKDIFG